MRIVRYAEGQRMSAVGTDAASILIQGWSTIYS